MVTSLGVAWGDWIYDLGKQGDRSVARLVQTKICVVYVPRFEHLRSSFVDLALIDD